MVHGRGAGFRTRERTSLNDPAHSWWSTPPSFPDASGWLVSTIDDYWSFVSMLLDGAPGPAKPSSRRREPFALMTTDRLTSSQRAASSLFLGEHGGWGGASPESCSRSARSRRRRRIRWSRTSGPASTPPPQPDRRADLRPAAAERVVPVGAL